MPLTRKFLLLLLFPVLLPGPISSAYDIQSIEQSIYRHEWPEYTNGASISALPGFRRILLQFNESNDDKITILYPGGEAGIAWAGQVLEWFVAFGIPGKFISMEPGSPGPDALLLVLVKKS